MKKIQEEIAKDLNRTFPKHILFKDKQSLGQEQLFQVLRAYAIFNPEVGYCQGMGFLVALLLNYMPEEDAFYFLITLLENYNLKNLYKPNLPLL